jgi:hypothetical protein
MIGRPGADFSEEIYGMPESFSLERGRPTMENPRISPTAEHQRLAEERRCTDDNGLWRKWGPYLSERQWGTVREDYSADGNAWDYFPHEHARSRAYRWGEDGLAGYSDNHQRICLSLALWNGRDRILKERLFGLTNGEGNHGEDCKEMYYYVDATPSHSYLKMLYKYPQRAFPYEELLEKNRARGRHEPEYEILDTGVFDDDRYFDVEVEYARSSPQAVCWHITVHNRGPEEAEIHLLPQLSFRNSWTWRTKARRPLARLTPEGIVHAQHPRLGEFAWHAEGVDEWLFTENETNPRIFGMPGNGYYKDAFHEAIVNGRREAVNPSLTGTKVAGVFVRRVPAGGSVRLRLCLQPAGEGNPFATFDKTLEQRKQEADEFYAHLQSRLKTEDAKLVQRQALAGLIWSKQFYYYDLPAWLHGDPTQPPPPAERLHARNAEWRHLNNAEIISMPDKWEYPWYAAWDLAFHAVAFAVVDPDFAKSQLILITREWYMHPNGQLPAYEWAFSDVNPPVHAWATWKVFQMDREQSGVADLAFLERVFHKLMLNFTWWVNRKDAQGRNIFQGGFLGLDNIGVFDRSKPLPIGGFINQADGTSWMAMYSLNLMRIALELALHNPVYEDIATKFFEHFLQIAAAMNNMGECDIGLWDEEDEFYYDVLNLPDGELFPLKVRSMVGLIPLFAVEVLERDLLDRVPEFTRRLRWYLKNRPELAKLVSRWDECGKDERHLLSLLRGHRMKCLLRRMLDETEFLSNYGVRALSKYHEGVPYVFPCGQMELGVSYLPAESDSGLFGGNSNWRGPIWMPVNFLLIESLREFHSYYGDDFRIECPVGSGKFLSIREAADELCRRLSRLFLRDENGRRAVFNHSEKMQNDPHFRDLLLFYEYFHGDTGRGVGASHQTGWTALVAAMLHDARL